MGGRDTGYDHTFVIVSDRPGGRITAQFSYTDRGPSLSLNTPLVAAPANSSLARDDRAYWRQAANSEDTGGVIATKIDASDKSIIAAGNSVNRALGSVDHPKNSIDYDMFPKTSNDGCNSNCAAFAVANIALAADGKSGGQEIPIGANPPGADLAKRVEDLTKRKLP